MARDLARWRERLLDRVLAAIAVLGGVAYAVSIAFTIQSGERLAAIVLSVVYVAVLGAYLVRPLGFAVRAGTTVALAWILGVFLTVGWGPAAAGDSFLLAGPVVAAIFFGRRGAYIALAVVALTVVALSIAVAGEFLPWTVRPAEIAHLNTFVSRGVTLLFLSGMTSLGIVMLAEGLAREVSARAEAEWERLELATAVEQSGDLVLLADREGSVRYANSATRRLVGPEREAFPGETVTEWFQRLAIVDGAPADMAGVWRGVLHGDTWSGTIRLLDPIPPVPADLVVAGTLSPVRADDGSIQAVLGVFRDVRRERQLEEQLRQASKLQAIGTLVSGIAHDFNNLLQPILMNAAALRDSLEGEDEARASAQEGLEDICHAAERGAGLVRRILTFTREAELQRESIPLDVLVTETAKLIRASLPASIEMEVEVEPGLTVHADRSELQQVLLNLANNAAHAMPAGGTLSVTVARRTVEEAGGAPPGLQSGDAVAELSVRDTGAGMDETTLSRVFEPFFTTKPPGTGTGLGLATVHGTVSSLGGLILPQSEVGGGTIMRILLPLADPGVQDPAPEAAVGAGAMPSVRHVLVVDDEELVLRATTRMLTRSDRLVTECGDPTRALAMIASADPAVDCVVTDLSMPGLDGLELARRIRSAYPRIPIVLVTGFLEGEGIRNAGESGVGRVLTKPFKRAELLEAIAETAAALVPERS